MAGFDIAILICFVILVILGGMLMDSIQELRTIKRAKLARAINDHPAGKGR